MICLFIQIHLCDLVLAYSFSAIMGFVNCSLVVGPNGIGKSTILKLIAGELQPSSGTVFRSAKVCISHYMYHAYISLHKILESFIGCCMVNWSLIPPGSNMYLFLSINWIKMIWSHLGLECVFNKLFYTFKAVLDSRLVVPT